MLHIEALEATGLSLLNVTLVCSEEDEAPHALAPAAARIEDAAHFHSLIRVLSILQLPATIHIPKGTVIRLADAAWPADGMTIRSPLQIHGASASSSVLDLSMLPKVSRVLAGPCMTSVLLPFHIPGSKAACCAFVSV